MPKWYWRDGRVLLRARCSAPFAGLRVRLLSGPSGSAGSAVSQPDEHGHPTAPACSSTLEQADRSGALPSPARDGAIRPGVRPQCSRCTGRCRSPPSATGARDFLSALMVGPKPPVSALHPWVGKGWGHSGRYKDQPAHGFQGTLRASIRVLDDPSCGPDPRVRAHVSVSRTIDSRWPPPSRTASATSGPSVGPR